MTTTGPETRTGTGAWASSIRAGTAIGILGLLAACAQPRTHLAAVDAPSGPSHVVFRNLTREAVRVYIGGAAHGQLLGAVPALSSARLRIPPELADAERPFRLAVTRGRALTQSAEVIEVRNLTVKALRMREWTFTGSALTGLFHATGAPLRGAQLATAGGRP